MPMDENEKKELVKKIMEQRKALWKGEVKKGRNSEKNFQTNSSRKGGGSNYGS